MPEARILLLEADETAGDEIAAAFERLGHATNRVSDPLEAIRRATEHQLVVIDRVGEGADPVQVCRELRATPETAAIPVLGVCQTDDVEERIRFLEAGADDVMAKPFDDRELEARIDALLLRYQRSTLLGGGAVDRTKATGEGRRIIVVYSPKGGVGTTTVAVNVATALARTRPDRVAIVDIDTDFGQVATHLNLTPRSTIADVLRDDLALRDSDALRTMLSRHSSGLLVLPAPMIAASTDGRAPYTLDRATVTTLVTTLAHLVEFVVIDAGSGLADRVEAVLELADVIVLPVSPEFPALKAVHALLDHFGASGAIGAKTTFVLNTLYAREVLRLRDIEDALGTKISLELPYDPFLYLRAVNEGVPVVIGASHSRPAERLERLAAMISGEAAPAVPVERKASGFRLFRRG